MQFFTEVFYQAINLLNDIYSFCLAILALIPDLFEYLYVTGMRMYIDGQIKMVLMAQSVAEAVLLDYEVYTFVSNQFNKLPNDLAFAAHAFGLVDAMRIIIDALATAFVLRVAGW